MYIKFFLSNRIRLCMSISTAVSSLLMYCFINAAFVLCSNLNSSKLEAVYLFGVELRVYKMLKVQHS